jgi:hypothetical protein
MKWFRNRRRRDTGKARYWEDLIARLGLPGIAVQDVIKSEDRYQLHCRLGRVARSRRAVIAAEIPDLARRICVHKRLPKGSVHIQQALPAGTGADFTVIIQRVPEPGAGSMATS